MQILSLREREYIEYSLRIKRSQRAIATQLQRDPSVIRREIARNARGGKRYHAATAQRLATQRARITNHRKLDADDALRTYVTDRLTAGWSPQRIAGRLTTHPPPELRGKTLCMETVYQWIYEGSGRYGGWYERLRRQQPKRRRRRGRKPKKTIILERKSIHDRPPEILERTRIGDWESDLIVFPKQQHALSVQWERTLRLCRVHRVANHSAPENERAITESIDSLPTALWKTITFDNGSENVCHRMIRDRFAIDTFFCDTYASWQKGGVEHVNGELRWFLPRTTTLATVSDSEIEAIQEHLNNLPRKVLGYRTPNEALADVIHAGVGH